MVLPDKHSEVFGFNDMLHSCVSIILVLDAFLNVYYRKPIWAQIAQRRFRLKLQHTPKKLASSIYSFHFCKEVTVLTCNLLIK